MKFNPQLKTALQEYEQKINGPVLQEATASSQADECPKPFYLCTHPREKVVSGDILWKPIDRAAAMLLAKSPWWAHPPQTTTVQKNTKTKTVKPKKPIMGVEKLSKSDQNKIVDCPGADSGLNGVVFGDWLITPRGKDASGRPMFSKEDMAPVMLDTLSSLDKKALTPVAVALVDAEKAIKSSMATLRESTEQLCLSSKTLLDEVRQTRFSVISEVGQMAQPLREIRQFFVGSDYKDQITRLSEFVTLCERLQALKASGFLDTVADTMIRLAINTPQK